MSLPSSWKVAGRGWGHPLHKLSPYVGGFPPALARFFVLNLSDPGDVVLDPFSGRGTTILEALLCGREGDRRPTRSSTHTSSRARRPSRSRSTSSRRICARKLAEAARVKAELDNDDLRVFFADSTLDELVRLREVLRGDDSREANFAKAVVCGVLHGPSKMFLSAPQKDQTSSTVGYVRRYLERNGIERPERDVLTSALAKARRSGLDRLPAHRGVVHRSDCRDAAARRRERRPDRHLAAVPRRCSTTRGTTGCACGGSAATGSRNAAS